MIGDRFLTYKEFDLFEKNLNYRLSGLSMGEDVPEVPTYVPTHNELLSIQGGAVDEYYHFTNAEHTELAIIAALGRGIADNNLVQIDSATAAVSDYAKFKANGLEGRSYAEVLTDIDGVNFATAAVLGTL